MTTLGPTTPGPRGASILRRLLGTERITLIDVGARGGASPRWLRASAFLRLVGFEAEREECDRLNAKAPQLPYEARFFPVALGRPDQKEATLYITPKPGCTGLYPPNQEFVAPFPYAKHMTVNRAVKIPITTLDEVCAEHRIVPDCMKLDVQGAELDVLRGAARVLPRTSFVELEVEFNPQYEKQPLFADLDADLRNRGFSLLGLRRTFWRHTNPDAGLQTPWGGQLIHGDVVYFNQRLLRESSSPTLAELLKLCVVLSLYRQDAFLCHLIRTHPAMAQLSAEDRQTFADSLLNRPGLLAALAGKAVAVAARVLPFSLDHIALRRAVDALRENSAEDWHDPDFF